MKHMNCIVVFNREKDQVLFCKRAKDPYRGLYNFTGGKVEPGYVGQLQRKVALIQENNELEWLPLTENFADSGKYAGDQNIAHIVNVALKYPLPFCAAGLE